MTIASLKTRLRSQPDAIVSIELPDGVCVPAHFHVTEVGSISKRFADCGGTFRSSERAVLQTWIGSDSDDGHRLTAGKLARIFERAKSVLRSDELPVEVEYETEVISQYALLEAVAADRKLTLVLGRKHTDCLAREQCGVPSESHDHDADERGCCAEGKATTRCC